MLVDTHCDGGITWMTLNNPPANAYSYAMMQDLDRAVLEARMDPDTHAIVLRGAGETFFCAGADIAMLRAATPVFKYAFCLHANETLLRLEHTPKPVIAALHGHTVGGGLEVALACDLRLGCDGPAKVGLPEVKLGVLPGTGGTQRLVRLLGKSRAFAMMASGDTMGMAAAHDVGLVDRLLPSEGFFEHVRSFVEGLIPPKGSAAVGLIKRAVASGSEMSMSDGLALERELQQRLFLGDDAREGLAAYAERRAPVFSGM